MIILTAQQAIDLPKEGRNNSRLEPIEVEGQWVLPEAVLTDRDYIEQRDFLKSLPCADVDLSSLGS